jgi:flagellar biosynthetic protein FliR
MLDEALKSVPVFVLVLFRIGGMMLFAPLFGSARIPRRVRVLFAIILALGMTPAVAAPTVLPDTPWQLALGIGGEMMFGLAMGMILSIVFIAVQWAGEIIGQQMGFNLSEVFDPQFGAQGSLIGDMYFMLTLVVFLTLGGHHAMLAGVHASFKALPLLSVGMNSTLFDTIAGLFQAATELAIQLAAPMLVTMLIIDLALGFIGKTMPQMNVMSAGLSMRSAIGMVVVIVGLSLTSQVISRSLMDAMARVSVAWVGAR